MYETQVRASGHGRAMPDLFRIPSALGVAFSEKLVRFVDSTKSEMVPKFIHAAMPKQLCDARQGPSGLASLKGTACPRNDEFGGHCWDFVGPLMLPSRLFLAFYFWPYIDTIWSRPWGKRCPAGTARSINSSFLRHFRILRPGLRPAPRRCSPRARSIEHSALHYTCSRAEQLWKRPSPSSHP